MISKVFSVLAAALTLTVASPVLANTQTVGNSFSDHVELVKSIQSVGVDVFINPPLCKPVEGQPKKSGFYSSQFEALVICQDNGNYDMQEVGWTDNDLDTIRHEAQHLVQDCLDGRGDGSLVNLFPVRTTDGSMNLREFVSTTGLPAETIKHVETSYRAQGASQEIINLEYEAWATAYGVPATTIAEGVRYSCPAK